MIDLEGIQHHPAIEELTEVLCAKTENTDKSFFRTEVAFFLAKMAATMRAVVVTPDRGTIPVNLYAVALAASGYGKGHSMGVMEDQLLGGFQRRFIEDTMPVVADVSLAKLSNERAARYNSDPKEEFDKLEKEYRDTGAYIFAFCDGTSPAIKQLRSKLLLANIGALNLQIDEIGSNLIGSTEVLNDYLELYDQGLIKNKLTKNTAENKRNEEVIGKTPTNMMLFGTPVKLFDGGVTENTFYSFLETGYARRCLFGLGQQSHKAYHTQTAEEIFRNKIAKENNDVIDKWAQVFHDLADQSMCHFKMNVEDEVAIKLVEYQIVCERRASEFPEHDEIRRVEMAHRHSKALKLAGAYAFVDRSNEVEMGHLLSAILLVEESGVAFTQILQREPVHVKLAKYIATCGVEVTHASLIDKLSFFKKGQQQRQEMLQLAAQWGCQNNIIIKKRFMEGIEFFKGETLEETDLNKMIFSYSEHWAYEYQIPEIDVAFDQLHSLTQEAGMNWCNHHFNNQHRADENVIPGFNMIVLDVDGGIRLDLVHELLSEIKFMTYTTKRHTEESNRFRLLIPTSHVLHLDKDEYAELVSDVVSWLPFKATAEVDSSSLQRSKKWMSCETGTYHYHLDGVLFDILPFIPKTSKNETYRKDFKAVASLDNLERWFAQRIASGNRNNQMIKFALALVDSGLSLVEVNNQVHSFNKKLNTPLSEEEIDNTIMVSVAKRFAKAAA